VSTSVFLSALRVAEDESATFFACQEVKRDGTTGEVSYTRGRYSVRVVAAGDGNADELDYVVLTLTDPTEATLVPLPVAGSVSKGESVRLYSAFNAGGFNEFTQDFCNVAIDVFQPVATTSTSHLYCNNDNESGTSGGPYLNSRGQVVAIHIASRNDILDFEANPTLTSRGKKRVRQNQDVRAKVIELCDVVSRIFNTNCRHSVGLVIGRCPMLCGYLRS
jgi:hypothetical protein